jgi:hypothetical protein
MNRADIAGPHIGKNVPFYILSEHDGSHVPDSFSH